LFGSTSIGGTAGPLPIGVRCRTSFVFAIFGHSNKTPPIPEAIDRFGKSVIGLSAASWYSTQPPTW